MFLRGAEKKCNKVWVSGKIAIKYGYFVIRQKR